jgi:uncharacterized repeat protein (TIGR03847 family)
MPRALHEYDPPDRFVVGTVGAPGQRTFFLQATGAGKTTSVALEKQQVAVLAERVDALLDEVLRRTGGTAPVPAVAPAELIDNAPLDAPIVEDFRVGTMALAWEGDTERVLIEAQELVPDADPTGSVDDEDGDDDAAEAGSGPPPGIEAGFGSQDEGPDMLRVRLSGAAARAFVRRALAVVAAGRPDCPFCGQPMDPEGHVCPRANGYRR